MKSSYLQGASGQLGDVTAQVGGPHPLQKTQGGKGGDWHLIKLTSERFTELKKGENSNSLY